MKLEEQDTGPLGTKRSEFMRHRRFLKKGSLQKRKMVSCTKVEGLRCGSAAEKKALELRAQAHFEVL